MNAGVHVSVLALYRKMLGKTLSAFVFSFPTSHLTLLTDYPTEINRWHLCTHVMENQIEDDIVA